MISSRWPIRSEPSSALQIRLHLHHTLVRGREKIQVQESAEILRSGAHRDRALPCLLPQQYARTLACVHIFPQQEGDRGLAGCARALHARRRGLPSSSTRKHHPYKHSWRRICPCRSCRSSRLQPQEFPTTSMYGDPVSGMWASAASASGIVSPLMSPMSFAIHHARPD